VQPVTLLLMTINEGRGRHDREADPTADFISVEKKQPERTA
jgi:hypothetical protein